MGEDLAEKDWTAHQPVSVYEMPDESAESLLARIDNGTAVLAFRVCSECAPPEVLDRIEDGILDLSDGDALAAQWPCEQVERDRLTQQYREAMAHPIGTVAVVEGRDAVLIGKADGARRWQWLNGDWTAIPLGEVKALGNVSDLVTRPGSQCMDCGDINPASDGDCDRCGGPAMPSIRPRVPQ